MSRKPTFDENVTACVDGLSPAERQVVRFFQENREEVLVAAASALASKIGTSDATVIRATKALGYSGMDEMRKQLADELRFNLSPASRLARTVGEIADRPHSAFGIVLDVHAKAIEALRRDVSPELFKATIDHLVAAKRVFIFGIGPSSAIADYWSIQLGRFGMDAASLTQTGLLLADGLHRLKRGDLLIVLAYARVYRELKALLDRADVLGIPKILLTDTLGKALEGKVDLVLPVARGRADQISMHTATLSLIEALLVGIAAKRPMETVASLKDLNHLRGKLVGPAMELPVSNVGAKAKTRRKRADGRVLRRRSTAPTTKVRT